MAGNLNFSTSGLANVLKSWTLRVPTYQRAYSWTLTNVEQFWDDLAEARSGSRNYFLGTLVMSKQDQDSGFSEVIDGQQRLATCCLLLAAIEVAYREQGDKKGADSIRSDFISSYSRVDKADLFRLTLSNEDHNYYKDLICQKQPGTMRESHRLLEQAYELLRDRVMGDVEEHGPKVLSEWADFLERQAEVVVVEVSEEADAFLIFETLNDRGLDLSVADLLKNYLFGRSDKHIDPVRDSWMRMQGQFESTGKPDLLVDFLVDFWGSRYGHTRLRDLYRRIREIVAKPDEVLRLVNDFEREAPRYSAIVGATTGLGADYDRQMQECVTTVNLLNVTQIRPLMLAVLEKLEEKEIKRFFCCAGCWSVRRVVAEFRGGTQEKLYCDIAKKVRAEDLKDVKGILDELGQNVPLDTKFKDDFARLEVNKSVVARYYLRSIESFHQRQREVEPKVDPNEVNLEHVLPQAHEGSEWAGFSKDGDSDLYVNRLGNMVLLSRGANKKLGNTGFAKKKELYAESAIELTKEVAMVEEWTKEEVEARQARLAELAVKAWPRG